MDNLIEKLIKRTIAQNKRLEKLLYSTLLDYLIDNISISNDKIKYTNSNIGIIDRLDKVLNVRMGKSIRKTKKFVIKGIKSLLNFTKKETLKQVRNTQISDTVTNRVLKHAATTVDKKVDLEAIYAELKQITLNEMSTFDGISLRQLRRVLKERIEEKRIVHKYFSRWTFDIYSQYQRVGANEVRKDLGLRFAKYTGPIKDNSRDRCIEYVGQVLHESEIEAWVNDNWDGKPETGYNPIEDCGGYHCYHWWAWISDELAFKERPELIEIYGNN